jgi:hypothetical protein
MSLQETASELGRPNWLADTNIYLVTRLGGTIPVDFTSGNPIFQIVILPTLSSEICAVYLKLSHDTTPSELGSALRGEPVNQRIASITLKQIGYLDHGEEIRGEETIRNGIGQ